MKPSIRQNSYRAGRFAGTQDAKAGHYLGPRIPSMLVDVIEFSSYKEGYRAGYDAAIQTKGAHT